MTNPIYAIGDVHGQLEMLEQAVARIEADGGKDAHIVLLGDYVDRGPDCRGVIDFLIDGINAGRNWTCLKGNHDRMMSMFLEEYPRTDARLLVGYHWFHKRIGGAETLASYGVKVTEERRIFQIHQEARQAVPDEHVAFLASLKTHYQKDGKLFVHAGIRPGISLENQSEEDLLWIRQDFLNDTRRHPWLVIHGHTHVPEPQHHGNRINLDSGAGYGRPLTAAVVDREACFVLTDQGRQPLDPC